MSRRLVVRAVLLIVLAVLAVFAGDALARGKSTYLYVLEDGDPARVFGYAVSKNGTLSAVPGSPFTATSDGTGCGGFCQTFAYSKKRKMLFQASESGLTVWSVEKGGSLVELAGSPFPLDGNRLAGVSVLERKKSVWVYASERPNRLHALSIAKDGTPTPLAGSPYTTGNGVLGVEAAKGVVSAANQNDSTVSVFHANKDGTLTEWVGSPIARGSVGFNVQHDPKGRFAFFGLSSDGLRVFRVDKKTASLSELDGGPFTLGLANASLGASVGKNGVGIAVAATASGADLAVFRVKKKGTLTALGGGPSTSGLGGFAGAHGLSANGKLFALVRSDSTAMKVFRVDKKSGALTPGDTAVLPGGADFTDVQFVKR